jgi:hypothetical protein
MSRRRLVGVLGVAAAVLTAVGLSGVGDAPDPHAGADAIATWFGDRRAEVLLAAPFGCLGAVATVGFALLLAGRLRQRGSEGPARAVAAGGALVAAYLAAAHVLWTTIAYEPSSAAKGLFVLSVLAVPVLGLGTALALGGIAGDRSGLVPAWLRWPSAAGAVITLPALAPVADGGLLSPDLQQQLAGNALLLWLLATGITIAVARADAR